MNFLLIFRMAIRVGLSCIDPSCKETHFIDPSRIRGNSRTACIIKIYFSKTKISLIILKKYSYY